MKYLVPALFAVSTLVACQVEDGPTNQEITSARTIIDFETGLDSLPFELMFGEVSPNYGNAQLTANGIELTGKASDYNLWMLHSTNSGVLLQDFSQVPAGVIEVKLPYRIDLNQDELGPDLYLTVLNEQGQILARADSEFNYNDPEHLTVSFVANKAQSISIELAVVRPDYWPLQDQYPTKPFAPVYIEAIEVSTTASTQQSWLGNSFSYVSAGDEDQCGLDLSAIETTLTPTITEGHKSLSTAVNYQGQPFLTGTLVDEENGASSITGTAQVTYPDFAGEFPFSLTVDQPTFAELKVFFNNCTLELDHFRSMPENSASKPTSQPRVEFSKAGSLSELNAIDLKNIPRNTANLAQIPGNQKLEISELIKASGNQFPDGRQHLMMFELTPSSQSDSAQLSFDVDFDQTQCSSISFKLNTVSANGSEGWPEQTAATPARLNFALVPINEPTMFIIDVQSQCTSEAFKAYLDNLTVSYFKYQ